jgi:cell division protein FtsW (lipid II flippase)
LVGSRRTHGAAEPPATPIARSRAKLAWPSLVETALAIAAIAALMPWFARLADDVDGRAGRFAASATVEPHERTAVAHAKNEATRALLANAGWQWSAAMLAGLALLKLSRTRLPATAGVAVALGVWATAAWAGRVPWPLAQDRAFEPARVASGWNAMPADFALALAAAALLLLVATPWIGAAPPRRQTLASRAGYAGFVAATGIGTLVLLDLSANGPPSNRYLALYHQGHLWLAMLELTVTLFLRPAIASALAWFLATVDELGARLARILDARVVGLVATLLVLAAAIVAGTLLGGMRQFTSELGRLWLVVGVAWFFYQRGGPAAERVASGGSTLGSLVRYAWPLAFVALVLVAMMIATRDMGPLLIASYAAGAFVAALIAMWWHLRSGAIRGPAVLAVIAFVAWIVGVTVAVFELGAIDDVTAGRLENLAAPLASANDQLALVAWFRDAAPASGFGLGSVPWCGYASGDACAGVPAQIQSDYTFTALVGAFGWNAAWAFTIGIALWLHRLVRHHGRVTRGEPRFVRVRGRVVADTQAFVSWIGVAWVVLTLCQLAVTVAGNLAVVPLTGVTFPFVSFGMTSLVLNAALLALCLNVNAPEAPDA